MENVTPRHGFTLVLEIVTVNLVNVIPVQRDCMVTNVAITVQPDVQEHVIRTQRCVMIVTWESGVAAFVAITVQLDVQEHVIGTQLNVTPAFPGCMEINVTDSALPGAKQCVIRMEDAIPVILGGMGSNVTRLVLLDAQVPVIGTQADVIIVIWAGLGTNAIKSVAPNVYHVTVHQDVCNVRWDMMVQRVINTVAHNVNSVRWDSMVQRVINSVASPVHYVTT